MEIILSRHGNTFNTEDRVVWVGAKDDLPLVQRGIEQARNFAQYLKSNSITPSAIYCGPLARTRTYAQVVIDELKLPLEATIDERLTELDYGLWSGLTNDEVVASYAEQLNAWSQESKWPDDAGWGSSESEVRQEVCSFANDLLKRHLEKDTIIVISSNGRLRYFLSLVPGEFDKRAQERAITVKTGHICKFTYRDRGFAVDFWNLRPEEMVNR